MSTEFIFYDLPSRHKGDDKLSCFSFNPWKTRMVLNYKGIPYTTEWTEYPELEPKLSGLGVPPNPKGAFADYSSPALRFPDGAIVMDSINIAEKLESVFPDPTLRLDAQLHEPVTEAVTNVTIALFVDINAACVRNALTEKSASWFAEDRKKRFGGDVFELSAAHGGEAMWKAGEAPGGAFEKLKEVLTKHRKDSGPFVLGSEVSYGDFVAASLFEAFESVDTKMYDRFMSFDDSFKKLHEACRPWLQRDN